MPGFDAQDFAGRTIYIGDVVIACVGHGKNAGASLVEFVVEKVTDNFVYGAIPSYNGGIGQNKISCKKVYIIKKFNDKH